ncbi:radical SAM family heme chaperone HemW [Pseudomarimonas salicorniae]|uniref:Heme chaperone HemW n=1 Tax=Pseudomarimonas salicorniae TaxID=2933270 RepID=A0ABT0GKH1_9GAMM|nr:radical SAM family heme chaperone HemW [Lysobacter sp. CAU 1642]MCK7595044.1 radical SAM family heme chaperone HemW [Lysobacter sp. CAU 1642]
MLQLPPLALYIHIPWCVKKCPYCDFNSHGQKGALPQDDYVGALLRDLEQDLPLVWGRTVTSIFFGGGTPSLFSAGHIAAILDGVAARIRLRPGLEVTLETNPGTTEFDRFGGYREAGVNRISFGVQSFDDGCLARLGRIHDSAQAERAVKLAQDAGLDNINLDLMYALPGQNLEMAELDVQRALDLSPAHISHYQLTLEPNTLFHARPPSGLPDEDGAWDMQERCQALLAEAGFAQYEVSAYAREGRQCQHNLNYWRFGDYLGIGAGAHGKLTLPAEQRILRRWKTKHPDAYLAAAGSPQAIGGDEALEPAQLPFEFMLNALRLGEGFDLGLFEQRTGLGREAIMPALRSGQIRGWLAEEGDHWRPTPFGARFLNDVMASFLPD